MIVERANHVALIDRACMQGSPKLFRVCQPTFNMLFQNYISYNISSASYVDLMYVFDFI